MPTKTARWLPLLLVLPLLVLDGTSSAAAQDATEAQSIVDDAQTTFRNFGNDPNMTWFQNHVNDARGLLIVPRLIKAGFIFGGSGGTGVFLARDKNTHLWSDPAFYTMGSVSWGLQIGGELAEVVLLVMTQKGIDAMLSNKFQLGADASIAAGPVGAGAQAATVDILQFSRAKGVFGGLTVEGAVIAIRDSLNRAYYGQPVTPVDILIQRTVSSQGAAALIDAVSEGAGS
jgi:lipid-binding SYLF domain-containing protein